MFACVTEAILDGLFHPEYKITWWKILFACLWTLLMRVFCVSIITKKDTPVMDSETVTHAHSIRDRVAGRNDLSYTVNSGKTHCT